VQCAIFDAQQHLGKDGADHLLHGLLRLIELILRRLRVLLQPLLRLLDLRLARFFALIRQFGSFLVVVDGVLHVVHASLKPVLRVNGLAHLGVLISELLSLLHHAINLLLRQSALVIGDGDLLPLSVALSSADTTRMPLASSSNNTSNWGMPRRAGGMPFRSKLPKRWLSFVWARSPSNA
jgi:hypothetical protein